MNEPTLCERCQKRWAEVRLVSVDEDAGRVEMLCSKCALEAGLELNLDKKETSEVSEPEEGGAVDEVQNEGSIKCPSCGTTFARFKERYRLGCSECFDAFREQLLPILKKVHGAERHRGKRFTRLIEDDTSALAPRGTWMLELLRRRLKAAVEREEFEEAARLRDRIEVLTKEQSVEQNSQ